VTGSQVRAGATFVLTDTISGGGHSYVVLTVSVAYNQVSSFAVRLDAHTRYSNTTFTKVRLLSKTTYDTMYLEVYCARSWNVAYTMFRDLQTSGWSPVDWLLETSIPAGYTAHVYDIDRVFVVAQGDDDLLVVQRDGDIALADSHRLLLGLAAGSGITHRDPSGAHDGEVVLDGYANDSSIVNAIRYYIAVRGDDAAGSDVNAMLALAAVGRGRAEMGAASLGGTGLALRSWETDNLTNYGAILSAQGAGIQLRAYASGLNTMLEMLPAGLVRVSGGWRWGSVALDMDFTGTDYDAKAKCQSVGLRFSDDDVPFLQFVTWNGDWQHYAGRGWHIGLTASTTAAILIPLMRSAEWQLEFTLDYRFTTDAAKWGDVYVGYISLNGHVGARTRIYDGTGGAVQLRCFLSTNDGDDTFTYRYTGPALIGSAKRNYKFAAQGGCVGVWDDYDDAWHWYQSVQATGSSYAPVYAFVQFSNRASNVWTIYLSALKLLYVG